MRTKKVKDKNNNKPEYEQDIMQTLHYIKHLLGLPFTTKSESQNAQTDRRTDR